MVGTAGAGLIAGRASAADSSVAVLQQPVEFRGEHQAGIVTEAQDRMHFCTFDITTNSRDDVVAMLMEWT
jgi:deferrochelatase/peroxidase EfeB